LTKKLAIALAIALMIVTIGCGDSKSPLLTYVARSNSDDAPHLFTLNEAKQQSTAVSISIPNTAYYIAASRMPAPSPIAVTPTADGIFS